MKSRSQPGAPRLPPERQLRTREVAVSTPPTEGSIVQTAASPTDNSFVRIVALLLPVIATAGLLSGCALSNALNADPELRALVGTAVPPGAPIACEWGSSSYGNQSTSWLGCWTYVPGAPESVARSVRSRLVAQGFVVSLLTSDLAVELTATRGTDTLCVDVLAPGFSHGRNTLAAEVDPVAGEVFLDIWSAKHKEAVPGADYRHCYPLPALLDE